LEAGEKLVATSAFHPFRTLSGGGHSSRLERCHEIRN
jgi:hypothetical protein